MGHPAAAAARAIRHGLRDRFPSILAATLLVVPILIFAAAQPRPVQGDIPTLDHFTIESISSSPIAGHAFTVTATAYDQYGNKKTNYTGGATVSGNLGTSPGFPPAAGTDPSYGAFGSWVDGRSSADVIAYKAETPGTITVSDGTPTGTSNPFTVQPAALDRFILDPISSSPIAGHAFTVTATAYDQYGNKKTDYTGGATVSGNLGTSPGFPPAAGTDPSYGAFTNPWSGGSNSADVIAYKAETPGTITVSDGTPTGTSNPFTVQPAALDRFILDPISSSPIAGHAFTVTATAYDQYGNKKTNYTGGATVSGNLGTSPGFPAGRRHRPELWRLH